MAALLPEGESRRFGGRSPLHDQHAAGAESRSTGADRRRIDEKPDEPGLAGKTAGGRGASRPGVGLYGIFWASASRCPRLEGECPRSQRATSGSSRFAVSHFRDTSLDPFRSSGAWTEHGAGFSGIVGTQWDPLGPIAGKKDNLIRYRYFPFA